MQVLEFFFLTSVCVYCVSFMQARERESAAYYAEFYRPMLSPEALAMMGVPLTAEEQGTLGAYDTLAAESEGGASAAVISGIHHR